MNYRTSNGTSPKFGRHFHLLFVGFILSAMSGSVLYVLYPAYPIWQNVFFTQGMGITFSDLSMPGLMLSLCVIPILWMMLIAAAGMSMTGIPIACGLFILRASALGSILTQLYVQEGIKGIGTAIIYIIPYAFISSLLYIFGIRESSRFSLMLLRLLKKNECDSMNLRLYAMRFLALIMMMTLAGVLQCIWIKFGYCDYMKMTY